jgi:hypothetical protein
MNYTFIILGIILILVLYVLYRYLYDRQTMVSTKVYLKDKPPDKSFEELSNPASSRYSYNIWIYITTLTNTSEKIFSIQDGDGSNTALYKFELKAYSDGSLKYKINSFDDNIITSNFPLQKWVCITVSVDNNVVDLYLDGKLVKSQKFAAAGMIAPTKTCKISFGNGDIYVAQFERLPYPIDPQTAWDRYMAGNGGSYIGNSFASYGANLILTKDQLDMKKFNLF